MLPVAAITTVAIGLTALITRINYDSNNNERPIYKAPDAQIAANLRSSEAQLRLPGLKRQELRIDVNSYFILDVPESLTAQVQGKNLESKIYGVLVPSRGVNTDQAEPRAGLEGYVLANIDKNKTTGELFINTGKELKRRSVLWDITTASEKLKFDEGIIQTRTREEMLKNIPIIIYEHNTPKGTSEKIVLAGKTAYLKIAGCSDSDTLNACFIDTRDMRYEPKIRRGQDCTNGSTPIAVHEWINGHLFVPVRGKLVERQEPKEQKKESENPITQIK